MACCSSPTGIPHQIKKSADAKYQHGICLGRIPTDWNPQANQQPTGLLVALPLMRQSRLVRAPLSTPPNKKNPPMQSISTAFALVDIPTDWNPQANQQPTGLLVALPLMRQSRLVRVPLGTPPNKKIRRCKASADFWWGAQWDSNPRSPDPQSGALTDYAMGTT